jgi:protocatechuate 3,4-dioxygenase alpha subunit
MECTPSQTVGPFFHVSLTVDDSAGCLAGPEAQGERIRIACRVLDGDEAPVDDAMIELWQADAAGTYDHPDDPRRSGYDPAFRGFGRLATNNQGACVFETIKPGRVPGWRGAPQAPHINVSIFARGLLKRAVTRIYFSGDPANESDQVLALVPENRRDTLMARRDATDLALWTFEVYLCGERETVFFDI